MSEQERGAFPIVSTTWMHERRLFKSNSDPFQAQFIPLVSGSPSYEGILGFNSSLFVKTIKQLHSEEIYLDVGAGAGKAILEYRKEYPAGASVIGLANARVSSKEEADLIAHDQNDRKFTYYLADFLTFSNPLLVGQVSLITEVALNIQTNTNNQEIEDLAPNYRWHCSERSKELLAKLTSLSI
jgi:hypothetical protein